MKKIMIFIMCLVCVAGMISCAAVAEPQSSSGAYQRAANADDLDDVIRAASNYLNSNLPKGSKIVILNIHSESYALSEYIVDELISNAVNDRNFTVVDRVQLNTIRNEQNFQLSGEVDDREALEIGKFFGAQTIVTGNVSELAHRYRMSIRALNVQTAQVQGQFNRNLLAGPTITALVQSKRVAPNSDSSNSITQRGNNSNSTSVVSKNPAGPTIGKYVFWPRLRPTRAGLNVNDVFIPQVTVTKDFIVIHFCRNKDGGWEDGEWNSGMSGFYDERLFKLQNLDNPSQFFSPVSAQCTSNGMGRIWTISYKYFNATRLKLEGRQYSGDDQPFVFEEIILNKPN